LNERWQETASLDHGDPKQASRDYFPIARQNEAARATDATAWVRSAVVVLIVR